MSPPTQSNWTATFSDLHTSCTITVFLADGETVVATWNNVSTLNSGNLYAGFAEQRKLIGGGSLVFQVSNYDGAGSITLSVQAAPAKTLVFTQSRHPPKASSAEPA